MTTSEELRARIELLKEQSKQQSEKLNQAIVDGYADLDNMKVRLAAGEFKTIESLNKALDKQYDKFNSEFQQALTN